MLSHVDLSVTAGQRPVGVGREKLWKGSCVNKASNKMYPKESKYLFLLQTIKDGSDTRTCQSCACQTLPPKEEDSYEDGKTLKPSECWQPGAVRFEYLFDCVG